MAEPQNQTLRVLIEFRNEFRQFKSEVDQRFTRLEERIDALTQSFSGMVAGNQYLLGGIQGRFETSNAVWRRWNRKANKPYIRAIMDAFLKLELQAIRREIADIRRDCAVSEKQEIPRRSRERPSGREGFIYDLQLSLADQIFRIPARMRIDRRITEVEKRVSELETRYGNTAAP